MAKHPIVFHCDAKIMKLHRLCLITALQVVDQADSAEPERTEALHSTPGRETDGLKTDEEEPHDKQSPRSHPHTEKVTPLKYWSCPADLGFPYTD